MINLMRRYVYLTSTTKILRNVSQRRMTRMSYRVAKRGIGATGREGKVVEYAGDAYSQYVVLRVGKISTVGKRRKYYPPETVSRNLENCARHVFHTFTLPPPPPKY
jgi:hypothetical protein